MGGNDANYEIPADTQDPECSSNIKILRLTFMNYITSYGSS